MNNETIYNIFYNFRRTLKQIREGSHVGLVEAEPFNKTCDYIREECLQYDPTQVILIAESLLEEFFKVKSGFKTLKFEKENKDLFAPQVPLKRYTEREAEKLIDLSISTLQKVIGDFSSLANQETVKFKIGINTKNFSYLIGLLAKTGVIEVPNKQEMYRFLSQHFLTKEGKHLGPKSIANNFNSLDDSASISPENPSEIVQKLMEQIQQDKNK